MANNYNNFSKDIIKLYLSNPSTIKTIFDYRLINSPFYTTDNNDNTILHNIVIQKDINTLVSLLNFIQYVVKDKTLLNMQNINGDTAMHIAVKNELYDIAKLLDNAGTDLTIKNNNGESIDHSDDKYDKLHNTINHIQSYDKKPINCSFDSINFSDYNADKYNESVKSISSSEKFIQLLAKDLKKNEDKISHSQNKIGRVMNSMITNYKDNNNSNHIDKTHKNKLIYKIMIGGNDESSFEVKFTDNTELNGGYKHKEIKKSIGKITRRSITGKISKRSKDSRPSKSTKIHNEVIQMFINMKYSEEDSKALKSGLYSMVKSQYPNINSVERANKMIELLNDKKVLDTLKKNIHEYHEIIINAKKAKENQQHNIPKDKSKKSDNRKNNKKLEQ